MNDVFAMTERLTAQKDLTPFWKRVSGLCTVCDNADLALGAFLFCARDCSPDLPEAEPKRHRR